MIPGNAKSVWNAVKIAKDLNVDMKPSKMSRIIYYYQMMINRINLLVIVMTKLYQ